MTVLVLGGTSEARASAAALHPGVDVLTSLAGAVRRPVLPAGRVRVGGFGGVEGLAGFLVAERISAVVDATHPFAARISANAAAACARAGVPLLGLRRPPWRPEAGDRWIDVPDLPAAAEHAAGFGRVFLTTGRGGLAAFAGLDAFCLIRVVDPPDGPLPPAHEVICARGPYTRGGELDLLRRHHIEAVVSKNSGGDIVRAKLDAARELGLPVVMVQRPPRPLGVEETADVAVAAAWVRTRVSRTAGA